MRELKEQVKGYLQEFWEEKFNFSGYTGRKDYWLTLLILFILTDVCLMVCTTVTSTVRWFLPYIIGEGIAIVFWIVFGIVFVIAVIGILAMQVRRCRAAGMSGGLYIVCLLLSAVGGGVLIFIYTLIGDKNIPAPSSLKGLENIVNQEGESH